MSELSMVTHRVYVSAFVPVVNYREVKLLLSSFHRNTGLNLTISRSDRKTLHLELTGEADMGFEPTRKAYRFVLKMLRHHGELSTNSLRLIPKKRRRKATDKFRPLV